MTETSADYSPTKLSSSLLYAYLLAMLSVLAAILTAAMIFQYGYGELPCPLCLLQRVAMFGVCFSLMLQFRYGFSYQNTGIGILFSIFLIIVSVRQTLLDIYPRPGHEYIGSMVFGIHMPVWSALIATALLIGFALQLILWGGRDREYKTAMNSFPVLHLLATAMCFYTLTILAINFGSVFVQCGFGQCHTMGYALLQ